MRAVVALFYLVFLIVVTWPGMLPFNRMEPRILGLPLSFAWPAIWVAASFFVMAALDWVEGGRDDEERG